MAFFPEFLHYSRSERRGIFILMSLIILLALIPRMLPYWLEEKATDFSLFEQQVAAIDKNETAQKKSQIQFIFDPNTISKDSLVLLGLSPKTAQTILNYRKKIGRFSKKEDLKKIYTLSAKKYQQLEKFIQIKAQGKLVKETQTIANIQEHERFDFDPNLSSKETLLSLGLSKKVVKTLLNFREKGGHFYKKKDLQKIYGLSEVLFEELAPFIQIPDKKALTFSDKKELPDIDKNVLKAPISIDINKATVSEWQQLSGIGPAYAKRIVKYRKKLGGFSSIPLVGQTYGIPDSTFQKIKPFLISSPVLNKIKINNVSVDELKLHPFIKWKQASAVVYYRQNHGNFTNIDDLKKVRALNTTTINQLAPYLDFD